MKYIIGQTFPGQDVVDIAKVSFTTLMKGVPKNIKRDELVFKFSLNHWSNSIDLNIEIYHKPKRPKKK